jgi:hypothetical protein
MPGQRPGIVNEPTPSRMSAVTDHQILAFEHRFGHGQLSLPVIGTS